MFSDRHQPLLAYSEISTLQRTSGATIPHFHVFVCFKHPSSSFFLVLTYTFPGHKTPGFSPLHRIKWYSFLCVYFFCCSW